MNYDATIVLIDGLVKSLYQSQKPVSYRMDIEDLRIHAPEDFQGEVGKLELLLVSPVHNPRAIDMLTHFRKVLTDDGNREKYTGVAPKQPFYIKPRISKAA